MGSASRMSRYGALFRRIHRYRHVTLLLGFGVVDRGLRCSFLSTPAAPPRGRVMSVGFRRTSLGRRCALRASVTVIACLSVLASTAAVPAAAEEDVDEASAVRIGVLALAGAIAAVGRTPELAEPLPFTRTSVADVLQLDDVVNDALVDAMAGEDLGRALEEVPGVVDLEVAEGGARISFGYRQTNTVPLELAHDEGDLRFGANEGAGNLTVSLATPVDKERFVIEVDENQPDPLLQVALVSQPELELNVSIDNDEVSPFSARQGFTDVKVTGGSYKIDRTADITLRDPDGRGLLTLEDLRYSNLPDLFRIKRTTDIADMGFDLELPPDVNLVGGDNADRAGTLTLSNSGSDPTVAPTPVWPQAADATYEYGCLLYTSPSPRDGLLSRM